MPFTPGFAAAPNGWRNNAGISVNFVTDFGGVGNGVTNNSTSLVNFNTFAIAQTLRVDLTVPAGTYAVSSNNGQFFGRGITSYTMQGAGSTTSVFALASPAAPLFVAGLGQVDDGAHDAKILADLSSGATSFSVSANDAAKMPAGSKVLVTGLAIQGTVGSNFGFPTNAQFFDYVTVTSASTITGLVSFTPALTDSYKTTWPLVSSGSVTSQGQGGPAWAYLMSSTWDTTVQLNDVGFTYNVVDVNTYGSGNQVTYNRCSWAGGSGKGPSPSQNLTTSFTNSNLFTAATLEVDKLITNLTLDGCPINTIQFQSASIKNLTIQNSTSITTISGTPRTAILQNNIIGTLSLGPTSYGVTESAQLNNNTITTWSVGASRSETLASRNLVMSSGVISTPRRVAVLGCSDNGSGNVRLTVADTTRLATSMSLSAQGLFATGSQNIPYNITVVSSVSVDILTLSTSSVTWTSSGYLASQALAWAVPNRWVNMTSSAGVLGNFKVIDLTEAADVWFVQTNLSSGWPANVANVATHPCPAYSGTGNTGCPEALEASMSGAQNKPSNSYINRTYTNTLTASGTSARPIMWGILSSSDAMTVNVTTPYTGGNATLTWAPTQFSNQIPVLRSSAITNLNMVINAKVAGARVYNGITGAWSGTSSGDTLPTFAVGDRLMGSLISSPILSVSVSSETAGPVINWEVKTDQGIV